MEALTYVVLAMASAMAGKHGLQLIIDPEADTFKTNGTVLIIPPIPKLLKRFESLEALEIYLMGAITHEVGHIKYTDRDERARFNASYATHPERAIAMDVGQIVEDVVIERLLAADNANSAKHLRNLWGMLFARFKDLDQKAPALDASQLDLQTVQKQYIFMVARHAVMRQTCSHECYVSARAKLAMLMDDESIAKLDAALLPLDEVCSTAEGGAVARNALAILGINAQSMPEQQEQSKDQNQRQPQAGQGTPAQEGESDSSTDPQPQDAQGSSEADMQGDGEDESSGQSESNASAAPELAPQADGGQQSVVDDNPEEGAMDAMEFITQAINEIIEDGDEDEGMHLVIVPGKGAGSDFAESDFLAKHQGGLQLRDQIQMHSMMARERLVTLLKAQTQSHETYGRKGKIVPSRLWKLKGGNLRVFKQTVEGQSLSTSIKILLDRSGSMSGQMQRAIEAAAFLPLALDDVDGITTSLDIFPGAGKATTSIQPFGRRMMTCLDDAAGVAASGGTPMTQALQACGSDLADQVSDRKMLVVVTDGEPDNQFTTADELRKLRAADVEVYGIGIGVSLQKLFGKDFVTVRNVGELTNALATLFETQVMNLPMAA